MKFSEFLNESMIKKPSKLSVKLTSPSPGGTTFTYTIPEIGTDLDFYYAPFNNDQDFPEDVFDGKLECKVTSRGYGKHLTELQDFLAKLLNSNINTREIDNKIQSKGICILSQYRKLLARKRSKPNPKGTLGQFTYFTKKDELLKKYNDRVKDGYFDLPNWGNKIGHDKESQVYVESIIRHALEEFFANHKKEIIDKIVNDNLLDKIVQMKNVRSVKI